MEEVQLNNYPCYWNYFSVLQYVCLLRRLVISDTEVMNLQHSTKYFSNVKHGLVLQWAIAWSMRLQRLHL